MPIKTWDGEYNHTEQKWVKKFDEIGKLRLYKWEETLFYKIKTRREHNCMVCDNCIKRGNYVYGSFYWSRRICINCFERFMNNFIISLNEYKEKANNSLKYFKKDYWMMIKNNVVASV